MSTPTGDQWVDGTYESGADPDASTPDPGGTDDVPNTETGVGMGQGEASSFEPEEDAPVEDGPAGPGSGTS